jgi:antitoxin ParD1/3/4
MKPSSMNISLPASLQKWVERSVAKKGYGSPEDLVVDVLRREQAQEAREKIDAILLAAIDSGESTPMTEKDWERIRNVGRRRFYARRKK